MSSLKTTSMGIALAICLFLLISSVAWWRAESGMPGVWQYNFAPASASRVPGFKQVNANTTYRPWRGYGWRDVNGEIRRGAWPSAPTTEWETRGELTLIARRSPDELAASFASAGARFAVDLPPGRYEVWVLSGDAGHLEYTPIEPYRIMVQGEETYRYELSQEDYYRQLEIPPPGDYLSHEAIWDQFIEPRFHWSHRSVDIEDAPLEVWVVAEPRDYDGLGLAGAYPYTEGGRGPEKRSVGALNALVIVPSDDSADDSELSIGRIDDWRQRRIASKWPVTTQPDRGSPSCADNSRYTTSFVDLMAEIPPRGAPAGVRQTARLRGTPGETISLSVVISPCSALGETRLDLEAFSDTEGLSAAPVAFSGGVVRYGPIDADGAPGAWQPAGSEVLPQWHWTIEPGLNRQFWINLRVPEHLPAGNYSSAIQVTPSAGEARRLEFELEVLPFRLQRPEHLVLGMTYFSPVQDAWFDEQAFWRRLESEFRDLREHGFTAVQYTGLGIDDYARLSRVMEIYGDVGFPKPLILLESYGAMDRLRREGLAWGSEEFLNTYSQKIADLLEEARRRNWPPFVVNFGDEFTNTGQEEFGQSVARRLREIPGIVTSADSNGYKELSLLAPEVDFLAFNNGWAGVGRVNGDRKLLNPETIAEVRDAGAQPWMVNVGTDRFSNGYWLWKMLDQGVGGKLEWIYRSYSGIPHNPFDAVPMKTSMVLPGEDGIVIHTLAYERMRLGLDDLAWLYTLEQELAKAERLAAPDSEAIARARALLAEIDGSLDADLNYYVDESTHWPGPRFGILREKIVDSVMALQGE